jgi:polar amino acid transport system permease protein
MIEFTFWDIARNLLLAARWTILLSAVAFVGGAIVGMLILLARISSRRWLRRSAEYYIGLFQGTPLLMQLFVVYYGLTLIGIDLDAWSAVAIGFTLHASAFLGEIWRGGIESLPGGQTEAAKALGIHWWPRMTSVVLPQAFKVSLPATVGFLVQLLKGTSLAAIVGFTELARTGSIVSNLTYKPLLVYTIVGGIYFLLCWPLSVCGRRLEKRLAGSAR